jgi:hypothetical protein
MKKSYYFIILLIIPLFIGATKKVMVREVLPVIEIEPKPIKPIVIEPIVIEPEITSLIDALIIVESQGNDSAVGDTHLGSPSIGVLQIRPIMVREVNRILKLKGTKHRYKMSDRWDRGKSIEMFLIWKEFHHDDSDYEEIARSWNGGPKGPKNPRTYSYWKKVENQLAGL